MKIRVADYVASFLTEHGVTHNFMIVGGGAMHLNDALGHQKGLRTVFNHHEQACAIAAEAYARLTGRVASVCVTSGPGGTNALTGVMGAWLDSIPMFILSGQVKRETTLQAAPGLSLRQLGDQEFDIARTVSNMTKYSAVVMEPEEIAWHLEKAWFLAHHGRKGPVWIDIPLDVQGAPVEMDALRHFDPKERLDSLSIPDIPMETTLSVLRKISQSKAPLLFAGSGVRLSDSADLLLKVVEKLKIPVAVAWNSGDLIAFDNPYYAGSPSREGTRSSNFIVQSCDLLVVLGSRMNIRTITYNRHDFARNAYKIMVDIDKAELKKPTFTPDMAIHGDVRQFLQNILQAEYAPSPAHIPWVQWRGEMLKKYPAVLPEYHNGGKLNPYVFIDRLFAQLNANDVLTLGNGSACVMTFQAAKIKQGQRMFTNSGCAAMGYGLPAALGAAVARQERNERVICIDGDGSLMMNVQEMETISYYRLNVKLFLLNNHGYQSIRQTQRNLFHSSLIGLDPESGVGFPDFATLSKAFSFDYFQLDSEAAADKVIQAVLNAEGPVLCNVIVDPEQIFAPKLSSQILPDGRIISPSMDDMFPFLPREEYVKNHYLGYAENKSS